VILKNELSGGAMRTQLTFGFDAFLGIAGNPSPDFRALALNGACFNSNLIA